MTGLEIPSSACSAIIRRHRRSASASRPRKTRMSFDTNGLMAPDIRCGHRGMDTVGQLFRSVYSPSAYGMIIV